MEHLADWLKGQGRAVRSLGRWLSVPLQAIRRDRQPGVVVLLYHRVGGGTRSDVDMGRRAFEEQMRYLSRYAHVVSLDEVARFGTVGRTEQTSRDIMAITFDDGYRDTYEVAYPILRRYGLPATIYVPAMYIEHQRPFDFGGYGKVAPARRPLPLTWDQAGEMMRSGLIAIGSHTHTHVDLSRASKEETGRELDACDRLIESRLGIMPRHFAYPWGWWSPATESMVAARYETVALGGPGKNTFLALDRSRLWRYPVLRTDGFWLFRIRMQLLAVGEEAAGRLATDGVEPSPGMNPNGGSM